MGGYNNNNNNNDHNVYGAVLIAPAEFTQFI